MKTASARVFSDYLTEKGIKWRESDGGDTDCIRLLYGGDNKDDINLACFFDDDEETMAIRCFEIGKVPKNKMDAMLVALNEVNGRYKWVRFYVDKDNDIIACLDTEITVETAGIVGRRCVSICVQIINEAYPTLMKALWG